MDRFFEMMATLNDSVWQEFAVSAVWKSSVVLIAGALAVAAMRRASASARHLACVSTLAATLVVPILGYMMPSWSVPVATRSAMKRPDFAAQSLPLEPLVTDLVVRDQPPSAAAEPKSSAPITALAPRGLQPSASISTTWPTGLAIIWGMGVIVVITSRILGLTRLERTRLEARPILACSLAEMAESLRLRMCPSKRVSLIWGNEAATPMTWGMFRAVIMLPTEADQWPEGRSRAVLMHELAHVKRRVCLTQSIAWIACAAYWFHPLAWMAAGRMRTEREIACDDLVLQEGERPTDYAGHLLEVARGLRNASSCLAIPMARTSGLESRVRAILDASRDRRVVSPRTRAFLIAIGSMILLPLAAAQPVVRGNDANDADDLAKTMIVAGRVVEPDGSPASKAKLAVVGRRRLASGGERSEAQYAILGRSETDEAGRFKLEVARTSSITHFDLDVVATLPGFGLGWSSLDRDAESPSAEVALRAEQIIEGRVTDPKGRPAANVVVDVMSIGLVLKEIGDYDGINLPASVAGALACWPKPVTTDVEGKFVLRGIGRGVDVGVTSNDPLFAPAYARFKTDAADGAKHVEIALKRAMVVSGRATYEDTGEPVKQAVVVVNSAPDRLGLLNGERYVTDDDGRYVANPSPGKFVSATVYPPGDKPYLIFSKVVEGDANAERREVDLAVPRGVMITGIVTERGSGRPLPGTGVVYENGGGNLPDTQGIISGWMGAVTSGADGRYAIAVPPGKGFLLFNAPTADYEYEIKGSSEINERKPGGFPHRAHAFAPYEVKAGQDPLELNQELTPGTTVSGRVLGPDGQPVKDAKIITTSSLSPFHQYWRADFTVPVSNGNFALYGLSRDRVVRCMFLDANNRLGATVEVRGAMADDGPLTVTLQRCGTATARFVDNTGKPVKGKASGLSIVGSPGPGSERWPSSMTEAQKSSLWADEGYIGNVDRINYWNGPLSDAEGKITLPALIPGAIYRLYEYTPKDGKDASTWKDFTVEPGKTLDLGDIRAKAWK